MMHHFGWEVGYFWIFLVELVRVPTWCFYSGSYLKWFIPTWLPFVEATNEGHLGTNDHRAQVLNYKKLGSKAPWITKISAGLLTRRMTQTVGWGQGF